MTPSQGTASKPAAGKPLTVELVFLADSAMMGLMAQSGLAEFTGRDLVRDFDSWMESEQRRVYALCQHMLQDRDDADSATQDVFLKAFQALKKGDGAQLDDPAR